MCRITVIHVTKVHSGLVASDALLEHLHHQIQVAQDDEPVTAKSALTLTGWPLKVLCTTISAAFQMVFGLSRAPLINQRIV
jgi:hypothetical protein